MPVVMPASTAATATPARVSRTGSALRADGADEQHGEGCEQRSGKREAQVLRRHPGAEQGDPERDAERGSRVHAQDPGVAERVAGERLDERPRDTECRAHDERGEGAREAQLQHYPVAVGPGGGNYRLQDLRGEQLLGPHHDAQQRRQDERSDGDREPGGPPSARPPRRTVRLVDGGGVGGDASGGRVAGPSGHHPSVLRGASPATAFSRRGSSFSSTYFWLSGVRK